MRTSTKGLAAIVKSEGVVPAPYIDPVGVWTFGIGHTAMSGEPDPAKMPRGMPDDVDAAIRYAFDLFKRRIRKYEDEVAQAVRVPLSQHEFDALVSFHFNTGAISRASATDYLNNGNREEAARRLTLYNKGRVNGQLVVLEGLVRRREEERRMFLYGDYPTERAPVWRVDADNKYRGAIASLTPAEVVALLEPASRQSPRSADKPKQDFISRIVAAIRGLI